ncbi:MAG: TldD/PmbA family protein [Proteobacteria bacterium]|nr:TldD/PmbA family protein [Pseudomonadota bacterium]
MLILLSVAFAAEPDPALTAASGEITRVMEALADAPEPPYYLSYGLVDWQTVRILGTNGALGHSVDTNGRVADVDVRVGTPELDNTHKIRDGSWFSEESRSQIELPVDGDVDATVRILWRETDDAWQSSVRRLSKVRGNEAVKVERDDASADFSMGEAIVDVREPVAIELDQEAWEGVVTSASAVFLEYPDVVDSNVELVAETRLLMFTDSEGALIQHPRIRYRVSVWGVAVADDGMEIEVYDYVDARAADGMPTPDEVEEMAHTVAQRVVALRNAPLLDPYTGPAILEGRASGVFFHEIFGHRMEGHRQKDEDEGQTFTDMVGQAILPEFLDVVDDPTRGSYGDVDLNGFYPYDDEGTRAEPVQLVQDGVLETFLTSRMPIESVPVSNGHGRRQPGNAVVARQGNLIVEASETVSYEELRGMLVEEIRAQDKEFGLIVEDITGGFTLTGRVIPNSFNVRPVAVWKVYEDGRPDELVRGGDLIGTPLATFGRIVAAGDDPQVFNGMCGAESGWVPVSAVAPSLLIEEIEVQRKEKSNDRPPLLDPPGAVSGDDS